jgi:PrgI family protein
MLSSSPSTSRKHTVPTHLNLPDQVLTLWSFSLTARQLLLLLVGAGIGGDLWHALAFLGHETVAGQGVRVLLALIPVVLALVVAWYRPAGRYLEVWCLVLLRYQLRPRRFVWRTLRACQPHLPSHGPMVSGADAYERDHRSTHVVPDVVTTEAAA